MGRNILSNKNVRCLTSLEFTWKLFLVGKSEKKFVLTLFNRGFTPARPLVSGFDNAVRHNVFWMRFLLFRKSCRFFCLFFFPKARF